MDNGAYSLCHEFLEKKNKITYAKILEISRKIGLKIKPKLSKILPTSNIPKTGKFMGKGFIEVPQTLVSFISKGRLIENIKERYRQPAKIHLKTLLLFDDSNSTTSWWRKDRFKEKADISCLEKILAIAFDIGLKGLSKFEIISFSSNAGFVNLKNYVELLLKNGSGATRLDIALELAKKWEKKAGNSLIIILSDGLPEAGKNNKQEDAEIQEQTIKKMLELRDSKVKLLYVFIYSQQTKFLNTKIGNYTPIEFIDKLKKYNIPVLKINKLDDIEIKILKQIEQIYRE